MAAKVGPANTEAEHWPRVSTILREMGLARAYPDLPAVRWGRDRGRAVHKAIELYESGMAVRPLHPDVEGPFAGYLAFKDTVGYTPLAFEESVVHQTLRYRGTLDSRGFFDGIPAVLDFKCSQQPDLDAAAYQLGAYALAVGDGGPPEAYVALLPRFVVQLGEDSYRVHDVTVPEAVTIFTAAVRVYWAQRERLMLPKAAVLIGG